MCVCACVSEPHTYTHIVNILPHATPQTLHFETYLALKHTHTHTPHPNGGAALIILHTYAQTPRLHTKTVHERVYFPRERPCRFATSANTHAKPHPKMPVRMFNAAVYAYAGACVCVCGVRSLFCAANSHNILMQFKANFGVHSITYGRDRQNRLCLPSMSQHIRVLSNHCAHKSPTHPSYTPAPAHFAFRIQSHIDFGDKLRHQHGRSGLRRSQTITGISFRTAPKTAHTPHRTRPGGRFIAIVWTSRGSYSDSPKNTSHVASS